LRSNYITRKPNNNNAFKLQTKLLNERFVFTDLRKGVAPPMIYDLKHGQHLGQLGAKGNYKYITVCVDYFASGHKILLVLTL
jgi:hypothetical protein